MMEPWITSYSPAYADYLEREIGLAVPDSVYAGDAGRGGDTVERGSRRW